MNVVLQIVITVISSGGIIALFELFRDWKSKKKMSRESAETTEIDNEKSKIGLGDMYIESIKKLNSTIQNGNTNIDKKLDGITETLTRINIRVDNSDDTVKNITEYLNGGFEEWLKVNKRNIK